GDIFVGKPVLNDGRFIFLELGDKKIVKVNLVGNIVDKYETQPDLSEGRKYLFFTLDDGSGQIRLKSFGDDYEKFKNFFQGQTIIVIGNLKYWNNETYISPDIIRETDPKYLLLRKLETEKDKIISSEGIEKEKIVAIKDKILDLIKNSENEGGIEIEKIIENFPTISLKLIDQEIQRLLEEGIIFEPRPGKIRYLG
ncbi:MAG: OB-fold nucleic acid binding domain-containing protein, partial [Candidatus Pacearchaeota archaeon]